MAEVQPSEIYSDLTDQLFDDESYTKELEGNNKEIVFKKGSKIVKVRTIKTEGAVRTHDATKTFIEQATMITNVDTTMSTYNLDQAKSIGQFLDKSIATTNNSVVEGGRVLAAIVTERLIPMIDAYRLSVLAGVAETTSQKVTATDDGYKDLLNARRFLLDARLAKDMLLFVNAVGANNIRLSRVAQPFTDGLEKMVRTGDIGMIGNIKVREVPSDLLPSQTVGVLVNPNIVSAPRFLDDSKVTEPSSAFGVLILGLYMYTCVVSSAKNKGVATIVTG